MTSDRELDVIVIGGGFAGATAARDLQKRGFETLLLEARDRLGGRTWTDERHGWKVELGGTWIHWSQPFVWSEIQRYGLEIEETVGSTAERIVVMIDGSPVELDGEQIGELLAGFDAFFEEATFVWERPHDSHFRWLEVAERDSLSVTDRIQSLELTPLQEAGLCAYLETLAMCPLDRASYVEMLRVWALSGATFPLFSDSLARYKLSAGTRALIDAIAEDGGYRIELGTPVAAVRHSGESVEVETTEGALHRAAAAVVAVPLNVLHHLRFEPPLAAGKTEASLERHAGQGFKVFLEVEGDPGSFMTLARREENPLAACFTFQQGEERSLLVAFGTDAENLKDLDAAGWQSALSAVVDDVRVVRAFGHEWSDDPLAQGTWCTYKKGQLTRYAEELERHEGRLFFASADHCEGWRGFIDGAIGGGARAATAVARALGQG